MALPGARTGSFLARILGLTKAEGHIFVLDHVLNLLLHCQKEERAEINKEDRPKYRNVEHFEKRHAERNEGRLHRRIPEFKLWNTSAKRSEFLGRR